MEGRWDAKRSAIAAILAQASGDWGDRLVSARCRGDASTTDLLEFVLYIVSSVSRGSKDLDGYLKGGATKSDGVSVSIFARSTCLDRMCGIRWIGPFALVDVGESTSRNVVSFKESYLARQTLEDWLVGLDRHFFEMQSLLGMVSACRCRGSS